MTDLERELLEAADYAEIHANEMTEQKNGARWKYLRDCHLARAATLRARAAHVAALRVNGIDPPTHMFSALTGPVPAKTETP